MSTVPPVSLLQRRLLDYTRVNEIRAERLELVAVKIEHFGHLVDRRPKRMHVEPLQDAHMIVR